MIGGHTAVKVTKSRQTEKKLVGRPKHDGRIMLVRSFEVEGNWMVEAIDRIR